MSNTYTFVMESGKREQAEGRNEFVAFLSILAFDSAKMVDYYGTETANGLTDIRGGDYFYSGLKEYMAEQDALESLTMDGIIAAYLDDGSDQ